MTAQFIRRPLDVLSATAAAALPLVLALWTLPIDLPLANWNEFGRDWSLIIPYAGVLVLAIAAMAFVVCISGRVAYWAIFLSTTLGFTLLALECIFPSGLSETPTGLSLRKPPLTSVTLILIGSACAASLLLRWLKIQVYTQSCAAISLSLFLLGIPALFTVSPLLKPPAEIPSNHSVPPATTRPNVYHFVLDAFSSDLFLKALESARAADSFRGFVYFSNTFSNFTRTQDPVPSFLTATLPDWQHMREWSRSFNGQGIFPEMKAAGYRQWSYAPEENFQFVSSDFRKSFQTVLEKHRTSASAWFADVWLARTVGFLLADNFAQTQFTTAETESTLSHRLFQEIFDDEASRHTTGEYVYAHLLLPHSPYKFDAECHAIGRGSYEGQSICVVKLIAEFLKLLATLGRLEPSIIIVQSDHAEYVSRATFQPRMREAQSNAIQRGNPYGFSGHDIERRVNALLVVKESGGKNIPLAVSTLLAQLLDVPATLYHLAQIPAQAAAGVNLFSPQAKIERSIDIYEGFVARVNRQGAVLRFGEHFLAGEINHYSFSEAAGWAELSRIPLRW